MSEQTHIRLQTAKSLSANQELEIVRAAFDRKGSPQMRARLASLLLLRDEFDDLIAMLSGREDLGFSEAMALAQAYLARETADESLSAGKAADLALGIADNAPARAAALALRGKAETRRGDFAAARASLQQALALDPHEKDACKRLVAIELAAGNPGAAIRLVDGLAAQGAAHARLFAARGLAHARLGDITAARDVMDHSALRLESQLAPPPGWDSIEAFNAALAEELLAHPGLRYERYGTASELTWRIDAPATGHSPLVNALLDRIAATLSAHIERVAAIEAPWVAARPATAVLRSWCVITESQGFESWHVHQFGWLSGSYYVRVPDSIAKGSGNGGCIAFGLPDDLAGEAGAVAFGTRVVRPRSGLMLAFPSHSYHRTFPHGLGEKRICFAFDLRPG